MTTTATTAVGDYAYYRPRYDTASYYTTTSPIYAEWCQTPTISFEYSAEEIAKWVSQKKTEPEPEPCTEEELEEFLLGDKEKEDAC